MAVLQLENVFKRYDNKDKKKRAKLNPYAVNDLSFKCENGEFIGILGPSGCGKTTTLRMIAGLESISGGSIFIGDRLVNDVHSKDRGIGLAFEDYALYPPLNVYDNIGFCLRAKKQSKAQIDAEINRIAPLLKIDDLLQHRVANLSGGQKQRVNIARAIVRKPEVLLLDEPLSHLDGKMRQVLRTEIKRLQKEIGCTTIIVTHDQLEAMSLADRILIMHDGVLQQIGTPYEVFDHPANEFVASFIGEPPMNIFESRLVQEGGKRWFTFEESDFRIQVPSKYMDVLKNHQRLRFGIRPTDIDVADMNDDEGVSVSVAVYEHLGDESRISIRIGNEFMSIISMDDAYYAHGQSIKLKFNQDKLHFFDIESGERI